MSRPTKRRKFLETYHKVYQDFKDKVLKVAYKNGKRALLAGNDRFCVGPEDTIGGKRDRHGFSMATIIDILETEGFQVYPACPMFIAASKVYIEEEGEKCRCCGEDDRLVIMFLNSRSKDTRYDSTQSSEFECTNFSIEDILEPPPYVDPPPYSPPSILKRILNSLFP